MSTHSAIDLVFKLSSVIKAHNVLFDPTVWILTYLFSIQAFDVKYKVRHPLRLCFFSPTLSPDARCLFQGSTESKTHRRGEEKRAFVCASSFLLLPLPNLCIVIASLSKEGAPFLEPPQACTSNSISCTVSGLSDGVGVVRGGVYAWRRAAGNDYGVQYSDRVAMLIMNHGVKEGRVFNEKLLAGRGE